MEIDGVIDAPEESCSSVKFCACCSYREVYNTRQLFDFPSADDPRRQLWIDACGEGADFFPHPDSRVCSNHFVESDFDQPFRRAEDGWWVTQLKTTAVPTRNVKTKTPDAACGSRDDSQLKSIAVPAPNLHTESPDVPCGSPDDSQLKSTDVSTRNLQKENPDAAGGSPNDNQLKYTVVPTRSLKAKTPDAPCGSPNDSQLMTWTFKIDATPSFSNAPKKPSQPTQKKRKKRGSPRYTAVKKRMPKPNPDGGNHVDKIPVARKPKPKKRSRLVAAIAVPTQRGTRSRPSGCGRHVATPLLKSLLQPDTPRPTGDALLVSGEGAAKTTVTITAMEAHLILENAELRLANKNLLEKNKNLMERIQTLETQLIGIPQEVKVPEIDAGVNLIAILQYENDISVLKTEKQELEAKIGNLEEKFRWAKFQDSDDKVNMLTGFKAASLQQLYQLCGGDDPDFLSRIDYEDPLNTAMTARTAMQTSRMTLSAADQFFLTAIRLHLSLSFGVLGLLFGVNPSVAHRYYRAWIYVMHPD
ncbi:uncharacterized protein LOC129597906 [Paramacrobiotus metropolitanus]|uniref:uncharacterized protein LOC129597906 n=1 Tax=Paramacrobiotus metropolitanus TaxID=2943436 RepID=UPI00244560EF|nr:uncharacterized protein LOC129597906 [Paramacrobiotus metropolitanus]